MFGIKGEKNRVSIGVNGAGKTSIYKSIYYERNKTS